MTAPLPPEVARELEKHILRTVKNRLVNWGRWWYEGNNLEIKQLSGKRNTSSLYGLMQHGRVAQRSGYAREHAVQVNEDDALQLHGLITGGLLTPNEIGELRRFYGDSGDSGTAAQGGLRFRSVRKLAGLQ